MTRRQEEAFSLVEIILALGIISFALVAVLGMFPIAVRAASDSQAETQAALIARSLFQELQARPGPQRFITLGKNMANSQDQVDVSLDTEIATPRYLAEYNSDAEPVPKDTGAYRVDIIVEPKTAPANLAQVTLTVHTKTASYPFTSLVRGTAPTAPVGP